MSNSRADRIQFSLRGRKKRGSSLGLPVLWPLLRSQGRQCESPRARPRLLALPPRPPRRARSRPGRVPVPSPRSAAPRTAPGAEPKATTDSRGANSWGRPGGPSSFRNPQKLTVFLPRSRHGEVTSEDPAPGQVRPRAPPPRAGGRHAPSSTAPPRRGARGAEQAQTARVAASWRASQTRSPRAGAARESRALAVGPGARQQWEWAKTHSKQGVAKGLGLDARVVR